MLLMFHPVSQPILRHRGCLFEGLQVWLLAVLILAVLIVAGLLALMLQVLALMLWVLALLALMLWVLALMLGVLLGALLRALWRQRRLPGRIRVASRRTRSAKGLGAC